MISRFTTITPGYHCKKIEPAQTAEYEGQEVYRINIELKEELISKHWTLIFSVDTYKILAIEFNHPEATEKEEEIIKFHGEYEIDSRPGMGTHVSINIPLSEVVES